MVCSAILPYTEGFSPEIVFFSKQALLQSQLSLPALHPPPPASVRQQVLAPLAVSSLCLSSSQEDPDKTPRFNSK